MNPAVTNNALPESVSSADSTDLRFRVLRIGGRRRAFRLEEIYWTILEAAAASKKVRLQHFVADLLTGCDNANHSAHLRAKAAEWCDTERRKFDNRGLLSLARRIFITITAPAFILDQRRTILAANQALIEMLRSRGYLGPDGPLQVRLGAPIGELIRLMTDNPEKLLRAPCTIMYGPREQRVVLNLLLVGEENGSVIMIALVSQGGPPILDQK